MAVAVAMERVAVEMVVAMEMVAAETAVALEKVAEAPVVRRTVLALPQALVLVNGCEASASAGSGCEASAGDGNVDYGSEHGSADYESDQHSLHDNVGSGRPPEEYRSSCALILPSVSTILQANLPCLAQRTFRENLLTYMRDITNRGHAHSRGSLGAALVSVKIEFKCQCTSPRACTEPPRPFAFGRQAACGSHRTASREACLTHEQSTCAAQCLTSCNP